MELEASDMQTTVAPSGRNGKLWKKKLKVLKDIILISVAFMVLFTAFQSVQNLQSSLNRDEGLGVASLSIIYASLVLSCLFLPNFVIDRLGCKWTIVIAMLVYGLYMLANFYASWYTLVPGAILLGAAGAPLWSAKCTYLTEISPEYANLEGVTTETIVNRFFGIFFLFFQSGQIWGNLISSSIFKVTAPNDTIPVEVAMSYCGAAFDSSTSEGSLSDFKNITNPNLKRPPNSRVMLLMGIYFGCAVVAAFIVGVGVNPLKKDMGKNIKRGIDFSLFIATVKHLKHVDQLLLIPLTIYSGVEQAFIAGDYTLAFVSCSLGVHMVGYVMITFGVTDAAGSFLSGRLVQYVTRIPIFTFAFLVHSATAFVLLYWRPDPSKIVVFFILAACWGLSDAVWQTQINSLYGVLFGHSATAAFANYRLWESLGFVAAYAYSKFLSTKVKLWIVIGNLLAGAVGYTVVEIRYYVTKQRDTYELK